MEAMLNQEPKPNQLVKSLYSELCEMIEELEEKVLQKDAEIERLQDLLEIARSMKDQSLAF